MVGDLLTVEKKDRRNARKGVGGLFFFHSFIQKYIYIYIYIFFLKESLLKGRANPMG